MLTPDQMRAFNEGYMQGRMNGKMARERVEGKNKIKRINLQERIEAIIEISICKAMAEDWHPKKMIAVASFNIKDLIQNNYRRRKQVRS